jgi:hypothetical protein
MLLGLGSGSLRFFKNGVEHGRTGIATRQEAQRAQWPVQCRRSVFPRACGCGIGRGVSGGF